MLGGLLQGWISEFKTPFQECRKARLSRRPVCKFQAANDEISNAPDGVILAREFCNFLDYGLQSLNPKGRHPDDWWEIQPIAPSAKERVGFPTQKPLPLYEKIIKASSNPGDIVLDPFCGCATTPIAAERQSRQWIGMDI